MIRKPFPKKPIPLYTGAKEPETPKLIVKNVSFMTSASTEKQFLYPEKPMVAVCGKSNVGKSSLINMLAGNKKLAKTSAAPGRTRLVNYFDFGAFVLADLPGYGFAEVSKSEKDRWAKTLDGFFRKKEVIAHVFMLCDSRHDPTEEDVQMMRFLNYHIIPFTVVLTKADKLSKMKLKEYKKLIAADLSLTENDILVSSSETGLGKTEILNKVADILSLCAEKKEDDDEEGDTVEEEEEDGENS